MEIFNLKEVELSFENMQRARFDACEIVLDLIEEGDYTINGKKVYPLYIRLPIDEKHIIKFDPNEKHSNFYLKNPITHLYNWDDIDDIKLFYKDGSKSSLKPYWCDFNDDSINLYQHGKYEVDQNANLTGKFNIDLYIEKLSEDLQILVDKRRCIYDYIYNTLWQLDPMDFGKYGKLKPQNVYRGESHWLTKYIFENEKTNLEEFTKVLIDTEERTWGEYLDKDSHRERVIKAAEYIYSKLHKK